MPCARVCSLRFLPNGTCQRGEPRIRKEVLELRAKHPRYGYRRFTALLRREGFEVNPKRVARIRREEGIKVSKKQRRRKRLGASRPPNVRGPSGHGRCGAGTLSKTRPRTAAGSACTNSPRARPGL